jgi:hypothetical protein
MLGNFAPEDYPTRGTTYKICFILFMLLHHIYFLNFLIAILSSVFEESEERGKFAFLSNRYQYIEKLSIPFKDKDGYRELVINPSPIAGLTIFYATFSLE